MLAILAMSTMIQNTLYQESLRPQFHFSAQSGWLNDPNGLVYYKGTYHLFFQHNPFGRESGNLTWGHATSPDLVHWTQQANAISPDADGPIWSGSAVVDWNNTAGLQTGKDKTIVCIYACAGGTSPESQGKPFAQCLSYSTDDGKTFTKYAGNPVLPQLAPGNRDPKVVWYAPKKEWIMALFLEGNDYALFSSPDLKHWSKLQTVPFPNAGECPDFFEIPVSGTSMKKWVLVAASGAYMVGTFDGTRFDPQAASDRMDRGPNFYAVQTFSDIPPRDGRRIQIAWMNGGSYPGMPFNQQMNFPCTLTLHATADGFRIQRAPVREIKSLESPVSHERNVSLPEDQPLFAEQAGDLFRLTLRLDPGSAKTIEVGFRGSSLDYDVASQTLSFGNAKTSWPLAQGVLNVDVLIDRTSVEAFGNPDGSSFSACFLPKEGGAPISLAAKGGDARIESAELYRLRSAWREKP